MDWTRFPMRVDDRLSAAEILALPCLSSPESAAEWMELRVRLDTDWIGVSRRDAPLSTDDLFAAWHVLGAMSPQRQNMAIGMRLVLERMRVDRGRGWHDDFLLMVEALEPPECRQILIEYTLAYRGRYSRLKRGWLSALTAYKDLPQEVYEKWREWSNHPKLNGVAWFGCVHNPAVALDILPNIFKLADASYDHVIFCCMDSLFRDSGATAEEIRAGIQSRWQDYGKTKGLHEALEVYLAEGLT